MYSTTDDLGVLFWSYDQPPSNNARPLDPYDQTRQICHKIIYLLLSGKSCNELLIETFERKRFNASNDHAL